METVNRKSAVEDHIGRWSTFVLTRSVCFVVCRPSGHRGEDSGSQGLLPDALQAGRVRWGKLEEDPRGKQRDVLADPSSYVSNLKLTVLVTVSETRWASSHPDQSHPRGDHYTQRQRALHRGKHGSRVLLAHQLHWGKRDETGWCVCRSLPSLCTPES